MNKPDIISKLKAYTIDNIRTLDSAQYVIKVMFAPFYKCNCNNWRKIHCKPMKRRKQLEKVKSFY